MGSVIAHDDGPKTKFSAFNNKYDVQGNISGQSTKDVMANTRNRMARAKTERITDANKQLYKTSVF